MSKSKQIEMTSGSLFPKLLLFSLPLIASGILQLLFNAADVVVVGRFAEEPNSSLAAVGSTSSLVSLIINMFIGISSGAGAVIARYYGARDDKSVSKCVHTSILIALVGGVALMIFGFFAARTLLTLMNSPKDVIDKATSYLQIYFLGMPAVLLYNFGSSILRAIGDTKRPLYFLSAAGVVNVGLNLLLVIVFRMDVAGVAIATTVSQCISAALVMRCLIVSEGSEKLYVRKLRIHKFQMLEILRLGIPAGLQGSVFSLSNVQIQSSINAYGSTVMAGNTAGSNIDGFIYTAMNALHHTSMNFTAQNYGAGNYPRLKRVLWQCHLIVTVVGLGLGTLAYGFGNQLISIYNGDPQVIRFGMVRMGIVGLMYFLCGNMEVIAGHLRGLGYSIVPMISSLVFACGLRMVWIWTVYAHFLAQMPDQHETTLRVLYLSYPVSWILTILAHFIYYFIVKRNQKNFRVAAPRES